MAKEKSSTSAKATGDKRKKNPKKKVAAKTTTKKKVPKKSVTKKTVTKKASSKKVSSVKKSPKKKAITKKKLAPVETPAEALAPETNQLSPEELMATVIASTEESTETKKVHKKKHRFGRPHLWVIVTVVSITIFAGWVYSLQYTVLASLEEASLEGNLFYDDQLDDFFDEVQSDWGTLQDNASGLQNYYEKQTDDTTNTNISTDSTSTITTPTSIDEEELQKELDDLFSD